ncbi:hypothetical protein GCM10026982_01980 [Nocardiopsis aegyptia]
MTESAESGSPAGRGDGGDSPLKEEHVRGLGHNQGQWRKSSYSQAKDADCVEVVLQGRIRASVRDSQDRSGPHLSLTPAAWSDFLLVVVTSTVPFAGPPTSPRADRRVQSSPK